jgi:hypothetical protein
MSDTIIVDVINRRQAIAIKDDGARLPITHWFDNDGDECQPNEAVSCVAEYGDRFVTIDLRDFYTFAGN